MDVTRGDALHERVLVVPHGPGIGDLVNERPLTNPSAAAAGRANSCRRFGVPSIKRRIV